MIAFADHDSHDAARRLGAAAGVAERVDARAAEGSVRNRLLRAFPADVRMIVQPHLTAVTLAARDVLFAPSARAAHVYFPETAVVSLRSDASGEVGTVGCEGMAGPELLLHGAPSDAPAAGHAVVEVPGSAQRMRAAVFTELGDPPGALHRVLLRYTDAFLTQVTLAASCNDRHRLSPRCAGWLLATRDRVAADAFPAPLAWIAATLRARRAGVSLVMRTLQDAGLIEACGTAVRILDAPGLEAAACGCHRAVWARYARLLPSTA